MLLRTSQETSFYYTYVLLPDVFLRPSYRVRSACSASDPATTKLRRVVSRGKRSGTGKWEYSIIPDSWKKPGIGNSREMGTPGKAFRSPCQVIFFGEPRKKIGKISGKVIFFQGKINFSQTNPEKVDQSFQKWLFISRREFPTK